MRVISLQVVDPTGRPIRGVPVSLFAHWPKGVPYGQARTNEVGIVDFELALTGRTLFDVYVDDKPRLFGVDLKEACRVIAE